MTMSYHAELSGTVLRSNERGLVLSGRDGWLNVSKYAGGLALPSAGARVRVGLDKAGFIRAVEADPAPAPEPVATALDFPERATMPLPPAERLQARIAALQAATRIVARQAGTHGVGETLACAEQLFGWLAR